MSAKDGVELVDRSELKISDDSSSSLCFFCFNNARGIHLSELELLAKHVTTRTPLACFEILNRFQAERCNKEGFDKARVCQIILTVKDPQAGSTQPRACTILNFASETKEFVVKGAETFDLKLSKAQRSTIAFEHVWNKGHGQNGWVGGFASPFGLYLWFDYLSGAADGPSKHMKINTDLGVLLSPTRPCLETSLARSRSHSI